jgi:hypothetical protein
MADMWTVRPECGPKSRRPSAMAGALGVRGHTHGHGEEHVAEGHALSQAEPARVARELRQRPHQRAVVHGDPGGEREDVEDDEGSRGDFEPQVVW